jgi:hypothetical protein
MQVLYQLEQLPEGSAFDVIVVGAGGAGMAAALFAAIDGASVLLVEHTEFVGGTTAWSAGTTWIPGTHHAATVNPSDTLQDAAHYLTNAIGDRSPYALREAFLNNGAAAVKQLEEHTQLKFRPYPKHPDYISDLGGSTLSGRALEPLPFDGRLLGDLFKLVRPPIPEFTVLGGMMVDRTDINHLLGLSQSFASFKHACKILLRHGMDRLSHPRGTRLVMGNALVGRLLYSLSQRSNVTLLMNTSVAQINQLGHVDSIILKQGKLTRTAKANGGVILASGGFNRHPQMRADMLPGIDTAWCPAAPGHTGQMHDLAKGLGARWGTGGAANNASKSLGGSAFCAGQGGARTAGGGHEAERTAAQAPSASADAFWAPVSLRRRTDGSQAVFPHFVMDRAKPGMLTVNAAGERFVNESTSYHLFALAMQKAKSATPAFLICDAEALRKYGVGMVRPGAKAGSKPGDKALAPFLADGYLTQANTLAELANQLGVNPAGLQTSVNNINAYSETGVDPDFHRGETAYQQNIGDATWPGKNPNLGALKNPPFFAVRLYPGDIGASTGWVTDANARVQGSKATDSTGSDSSIPGLYAVGNDMNSIMGGVYTAPGITIGPGIVFGYLAAKHAGARAAELITNHQPGRGKH